MPYAGAAPPIPSGRQPGPHTQLAQNIALCWLAGARIFELKTVQINDRLTLSRPCIDMATVGYNTEWSQELRLDESLREYVKASMLIEILGAGDVAGDSTSGLGTRDSGLGPNGFVFDISVGYDLEGIRSPAIVRWLESMRDAGAIVDELRRTSPTSSRGSGTTRSGRAWPTGVTLSTFHGTPGRRDRDGSASS